MKRCQKQERFGVPPYPPIVRACGGDRPFAGDIDQRRATGYRLLRAFVGDDRIERSDDAQSDGLRRVLKVPCDAGFHAHDREHSAVRPGTRRTTVLHRRCERHRGRANLASAAAGHRSRADRTLCCDVRWSARLRRGSCRRTRSAPDAIGVRAHGRAPSAESGAWSAGDGEGDHAADRRSLSVCGAGVKGLGVRHLRLQACGVGPESMSRWSARSEARTYDLDVDEDRCMLVGCEGCRSGVSSWAVSQLGRPVQRWLGPDGGTLSLISVHGVETPARDG